MVDKKHIINEFEVIVDENLKEKYEQVKEKTNCKKCRFYDNPWVWGSELHCCSHNHQNPQTSRNIDELYNQCPIGGENTYKKTYIKQYGIVHREPKDEWDTGSIQIVDFSSTCFEADGYNPDVNWENIVIFFYRNDKEKETMMKLAVEYYKQFNLEANWVEKRYYNY